LKSYFLNRLHWNFIKRKNLVGCLNPKKFHGKFGQLKLNKCNYLVKMVIDLIYLFSIEIFFSYLERQFMREKLSDTLTERIFQITEIM